ncbi:hypothetical protein QQX98_008042 [Neonectria punicea]|uniref:Uncharacterized protein n=1 Tax=Neonectria punicea TaxID=979145 RepID=A0ABR1GW89_9HYPO
MRQELIPQAVSALMTALYDLPLTEVKQSRQFHMVQTSGLDLARILLSISSTPQPSIRPLHLLYLLLMEIHGDWPTFQLIKCHARLFKLIPGEAKAHKDGNSAWLVEATSELVKKSYTSFLQFIGCENRPALRATNADSFITYRGLHHFVNDF